MSNSGGGEALGARAPPPPLWNEKQINMQSYILLLHLCNIVNKLLIVKTTELPGEGGGFVSLAPSQDFLTYETIWHSTYEWFILNTSFARIRRIFQLHAKKFEYYIELCVLGGGGASIFLG